MTHEHANAPVVYAYTLDEAIADGVLVEIFADAWEHLSGGKPMVATAGVREAYSNAALVEIWDAYVEWRRTIEPTLPEDERLFATTMNGKTVWVIEDGQAFTILHPEDY